MNKDLRLHGRIKERGAKKWTSLMLPEHIAQLREWQAEDDKVERPDLTDWQFKRKLSWRINVNAMLGFKQGNQIK